MISCFVQPVDALQQVWCLSVISTLGACACYGMSWLCGREVVCLLWPDRLAHFSAEVKKQKTNMLSYIVLLRATPVLPNTFINVASPMVNVPLTPFVLGKLVRLHYTLVY